MGYISVRSIQNPFPTSGPQLLLGKEGKVAVTTKGKVAVTSDFQTKYRNCQNHSNHIKMHRKTRFCPENLSNLTQFQGFPSSSHLVNVGHENSPTLITGPPTLYMWEPWPPKTPSSISLNPQAAGPYLTHLPVGRGFSAIP